MLNSFWDSTVEKLEYAFQPVVDIYTGVVVGYEALIRNYEKCGFNSIETMFDLAFKEQVLYKLEVELRKKALKKFISLNPKDTTKLFLNVDTRVIQMPDYVIGNSKHILYEFGLSANSLCFEISDKKECEAFGEIKSIVNLTMAQGFQVSIDNFGTGFLGFKMLYHITPNYIKVDRFFISEIDTDQKKRLFISSIINIARKNGIKIVAVGIETKKEFLSCKDLGCDFIQGYFIQEPTINVSTLKLKYEEIEKLNEKYTRKSSNDKKLISSEITHIEPILVTSTMSEVLNRFGKDLNQTFIPVVEKNLEPVGIIREQDLKRYVYSMYGKELLINRTKGKNIRDFVKSISVADIRSSAEHILEIFSNKNENEGIIITQDLKYKGILTASSLLKIINHKNLMLARNQNPLTKLAGNILINEYISSSLSSKDTSLFVYFDFDNFKPYNDKYGFRQGDRAIMLFSDILKIHCNKSDFFIGHIGGDDFFLGVKNSTFLECYKLVEFLIEKFRNDVLQFYSDEDRKQGFIKSFDRDGFEKKFKLLTVSSVILETNPKSKNLTLGQVSETIAELKKIAKKCDSKIASASII